MAKLNIEDRFHKDIEIAINYLKTIGCTEIYLFGSINRGDAHKHSDIDLAVKGIPPELFFLVYGELMLRLSHQIDLIDLDLQQEFGQILLNSGELTRVA